MDEDIADEDEDSEEEDEDSFQEDDGILRTSFIVCVVASSLVCFSALRWFTVQVTRHSVTSV